MPRRAHGRHAHLLRPVRQRRGDREPWYLLYYLLIYNIYLSTIQYLEISIFLYAGIGKSVKFTDISLDNLTEALSEVMKTSALHQTS